MSARPLDSANPATANAVKTDAGQALPAAGAEQSAITALLRPASIVVLGASSKRSTAEGNRVLAGLRMADHADKVFVVHPTAGCIDGFTVYPQIQDLPVSADVAYVSLPAAYLLPVLRQLEHAGCKSAIVPTAGFTSDELHRLRDFVAHASMAVHGPNCMGVINYSERLSLWSVGGSFTRRAAGNIALVTQSGSAAYLAQATEGADFSKIISTGNELRLHTSDYVRWLASDPHTAVVGVILESIADIEDFGDAVAALRSAGKPIVALKVGGSRAGALASMAHTGALIGRDEAYTAYFRSLDIPLVHDYDEMAVTLGCLANSLLARPAGTRVGIVTDSGGEAALMADLAELENVALAEFSPTTVDALVAINHGIEINNPLDAGSAIEAPDESYLQSYLQVLEDPNVDSLLVVVEAHGSMPTEHLRADHPIISGIRIAAESMPGKPILAVSSSSIDTSRRFRELLGRRVPLLRGMRNGLAAARALAGNQQPIRGARLRPSAPPPSLDELRTAVAECCGPLEPRLTRRIVAEYGLPLVDSFLAANVSEAAAWAEGRYPVVVKAASAALPHRSDIGAVITDVSSPGQLDYACGLIAERVQSARPDIVLDCFEVQAQVSGQQEAMVGFASDPVFGALVSVGSGGTLVEMVRDIRFGIAPLELNESIALIGESRLGLMLSGYRNLLPATNLEPLADLVVRVSWLAHDFRGLLGECDLNPTFVQLVDGEVRIGDILLVAREHEADSPRQRPDTSSEGMTAS